MRDGATGWKIGTVYLNERDGRLRLTVSYTAPLKDTVTDPDTAMQVEFGDELDSFITLSCPAKRFSGFRIHAHETRDWLARMEVLNARYEAQRKSLGRGNRKVRRRVRERENRRSVRRANGTKHWNHVWTRTIIDHCRRLQAGKVVVVNRPEGEVFGFSWPWAQFEQFLAYKADEMGGTVEYATANV